MTSTKSKRKLAVIKSAKIIPAGLTEIASAERTGHTSTKGTLRELPIDQIHRNPNQPRTPTSKSFTAESLNELAESITQQGVIQPIVVRHSERGFEIVAGERRWRAAQIAGLVSIPSIVRDVDDQTVRIMALIENLQRENLDPIEEAMAMDAIRQDTQYTLEQLGKLLGKAKNTISTILSLLRLTPEVQDWVRQGHLDASLARSLVTLPAHRQIAIAQRAIDEHWTARRMEQEKARLNTNASSPSNHRSRRRQSGGDPNLSHLNQRLSELYGAPIEIKPKGQGRGEIIIRYASILECEGILERMGYKPE